MYLKEPIACNFVSYGKNVVAATKLEIKEIVTEYRKQRGPSALTSALAIEISELGKVPFYCCAWSNIPSTRNAIKSGFVPSGAELTVKPADFVDKANKV